MALDPAKQPTALEPVPLACDFVSWYSGVPWTWKHNKVHTTKDTQNKVHNAKNTSSTVSPIELSSKVGETLDSPVKSVQILSIPANRISSDKPAPTSAEEPPLHIVAPYFEIKKSPKGGYGAFALQDIPVNTSILTEAALLKASSCTILEQFDNLSKEEKEAYMRLASFDALSSNKVKAIFKTNRFTISSGVEGIFLRASRFNHSCLPSCTYYTKYDTKELVLRTTSAILTGQEMTISYGLTGKELLKNWGFNCDCRICSFDALDVNP